MRKCPKCQSDDVHVIGFPAWYRTIGSYIPIGALSAAPLDHHVCASCGFVESYVRDPGALKKIARKWPLAET